MIAKKKIKMILNRYLMLLLFFALALSFSVNAFAENNTEGWTVTNYWKNYKNGPPADPNFFPLEVWLQNVNNAAKYKAAGMNTYWALWDGPKPGQIEALKAAGMYLICEMNEEALKHRDDKTIIGWMMQDEPDNCSFSKDITINGKTWKYGPQTSRVSPEDELDMYNTIKKEDPTRPVWLGLGCGVANKQWAGRGAGWKDSMYLDYVLSLIHI